MREFYILINEYPWTTILLGLFVICLFQGIIKIIDKENE